MRERERFIYDSDIHIVNSNTIEIVSLLTIIFIFRLGIVFKVVFITIN